jgi:chromosomal replication initiation ATPase DnaA
MGRADFVVTEANAADLEFIDTWFGADEPGIVICGASSAGKSHLASILAESASVGVSMIAEDGGIDVAADDRLLVLDRLERLKRPRLLFDLLSQSKSRGGRVVLVGRGNPVDWADDLKDLRTRLEALPRLVVSPPDEALLVRVIGKLFNDLQVRVDEKVIEYAAPRINRSLASAVAFVALADEAAIAAKSPVTIPIARKAIGNLPPSGLGA